MGIVTARMHHIVILGFVRRLVPVSGWEGIHIGSQHDSGAARTAVNVQVSNNAMRTIHPSLIRNASLILRSSFAMNLLSQPLCRTVRGARNQRSTHHARMGGRLGNARQDSVRVARWGQRLPFSIFMRAAAIAEARLPKQSHISPGPQFTQAAAEAELIGARVSPLHFL